MNLTLYQTLEDRGNPDEVESKGPFLCNREDAWLGPGFYFWDTHPHLAHWWGETVHGRDNYIICRSRGIKDETCWDLHGDGNHRVELEEVCKEIVNAKLTTKEKLLVPQAIAYLKKKDFFVYKAIRALGTDSILKDHFVIFRLKFRPNKKSYLDLRPPVQVCLLEKKALSLKGYTIVFPEDYIDCSFA